MDNKILSVEDAARQVRAWQKDGKKVGFTNGCFDLLHSGHLKSFYYTREYCDKLIVAVNTDFSVKKLKGENRPVNNETERALLLAALTVVDLVVLFGEDTPLEIIRILRPDILAKGADYQKHHVVGHDVVESYGGKVILVPLKEGYSTTTIISRMK